MHEPILALEGALGAFSVAILRDGDIVAESVAANVALEVGLRLVREQLDAAKLDLRSLGGIAVGTGPGGFTGLRIAIAFAKSLALGAGRPLAGVSSFDILDASAGAQARLPRLTVVFGRPQIACIRRVDERGTRVACGRVAEVVARVTEEAEEVTIVGGTEDVWSRARERATSVHLLSPGSELPAAALARVARMRPPAASLHEIAPDYGEVPAARLRK